MIIPTKQYSPQYISQISSCFCDSLSQCSFHWCHPMKSCLVKVSYHDLGLWNIASTCPNKKHVSNVQNPVDIPLPIYNCVVQSPLYSKYPGFWSLLMLNEFVHSTPLLIKPPNTDQGEKPPWFSTRKISTFLGRPWPLLPSCFAALPETGAKISLPKSGVWVKSPAATRKPLKGNGDDVFFSKGQGGHEIHW